MTIRIEMARYAGPDSVHRAERMLDEMRITMPIAALNAARTAQRARSLPGDVVQTRPLRDGRLAGLDPKGLAF